MPGRINSSSRGFTLTELAVVVAIVGLLLGTLMYTLSAQTEQRNFEETRRRLDIARELLLSFAIARGRLPCPAVCTNPPSCTAGSLGDESPAGGGPCTSSFGGMLPARAIGFQQVDAAGYAVDVWGNRIRYAVASALTGCSGTSITPHFTVAVNLKANGITCQPNDLVICKSASGITATGCAPPGPPPLPNSLTNQNVVVAIVFSVGKNGALACATCLDEAANTNGDQVFVSHAPAPAGAAGGEFDDQLVWIAAGEFYGRLIAAGVLP